MKCFSQIVAVSLVVATAIGTSNVATATPIDIVNAGFDDQALANNRTIDPITGWSTSGSGENIQWAGAWNPFGSDAPDNATLDGFIGASGDTGTPQGGNGANVLDLYVKGTGTVSVQQTLTERLKAGKYTLTVAVGEATGGTPLDSYQIGIGTTGSSGPLASGGGSSVSVAELTDVPVILTVTDDNSYLSQFIVLTISGSNSTGIRATQFDRVRLDYVGVPEPGTMMLFVSSLIGLLAYAWRKRK